MGVSGLAEGFLAGFNTMDRYERGKQMDARADREQGLREAALLEQKAQQKLNNQRYDSEVAYRKERDSLQDARQSKQDSLNEMSLKASIANSQASNARAARAEARQVEMYEWEKDRLQQQKFLEENMPIIQQGWADIQAGKTPSERFFTVVNNKYTAMYNPERYMRSEYADAGKTFVTHTAGLMRDAEAGKLDWNSDEGVQRINQPEFLKAAGVLYQDEVKTGIGDVDPQTGKTIKNKALANVHVTPDGTGVVLGVKVTYDDGSTAIRPVTEGRSARQDDQPKVIPLMDFVGPAYRRAALAHSLSQNAEQLRTLMGLTPGADMKGYRKAVVDVNAETDKNISMIRRDIMIPEEQRQAAIDAERQAAEAKIMGLRSVFGLEPAKSRGDEQEPKQSALTTWTGADPLRQQFIKEAAEKGKALADNVDPKQLDTVYNQWIANVQASNTANTLRADGGNQAASTSKAPAPDNSEVTINIKKPHVLKSAAEIMSADNSTMAEAYRRMSKD